MPLPRSAVVERLHGRHVLGHRRRHLETVLVEQVLAVHQDEDRDVEGDADQLVLVGRDALQQGLGEVVPVEIGQRQIALAVVVLARIDGVADEQRRPGLVQIVEIVGAGLVPGRRPSTFCSTCSSGTISISTSMPVWAVNSSLASRLGDDGGRRRLGDEADLRALVLASHIPEPFRHLRRGAAVGQRRRRRSSRKRPVPAQHGGREAGEPDTGDGRGGAGTRACRCAASAKARALSAT